MIRCHLARMMGEHKMRIADVARETGLSRATVTLLYKETAQKVDLEAIEKLCLLFECRVGDLLELQSVLKTQENSSHGKEGRDADN
ncbi:MAG: XRE family transcriptional regulator [Pelagibaca sp.]|jgi:putative transcriptional regulator|nr:XRE family transcriptional regulator [Pelagibaca sp.]|tara:strand:+ start:303 stop:560 length:258 start_codon:yes stop_codon:yes gene_type:complete